MRLLIIFSLILYSCKSENNFYYSNDQKISDKNGIPIGHNINWVPKYIRNDTGFVNTGIDTSKLNKTVNIWERLKEPILYNYYLGYDSYRFFWARSFERLIVLSLKKHGKTVYLCCKTLQDSDSTIKEKNKQEIIDAIKEKREKHLQDEKYNNGSLEIDSTIKLNNGSEVVCFKPKILQLEDWNKFEQILGESNFWNLIPYVQYSGLDGSRWTIEANLKNKYWFHSTWNPENSFLEAGDFLIRKSGLDETKVLR